MKTNQKTGWTLGGIALLAFLALGLYVNGQNRAGAGSSQYGSPPAISNQTAVPQSSSAGPDPHQFETMIAQPSMLAQGRPAIKGPVDDISIRNYIAANQSSSGVSAQGVQIVSILYVTVEQLRTEVGIKDAFWNDFPADMPLAYVLLTGEFTADTDPAATSPEAAVTVYHTSYRIFSVSTGNELSGGAGPK